MESDLEEIEVIKRSLHDGINVMKAFGWVYPAHSALICGRDDAVKGFKKFLAGTTCMCKFARCLQHKEAEAYVSSITKAIDDFWPDILNFLESMGSERRTYSAQLRFIVSTLSKYSPTFSLAVLDSPLGAECFRKDSNTDPLSELSVDSADSHSSLLSMLGEVPANKSLHSILEKIDLEASVLSFFPTTDAIAVPCDDSNNDLTAFDAPAQKLELVDLTTEAKRTNEDEEKLSESHSSSNPKVLLYRLRNARMREVVAWARKIRCQCHRRYPMSEGGWYRCKESCYVAVAPLKRPSNGTWTVNRTLLDLWSFSILGGWRCRDEYTAKRSPWFSIFVPNITQFQLRSCDVRRRSVSIWHGHAPYTSKSILVFESAEEASAWCSFLLMFLTTLRDAIAWHSSLENKLVV